MSAMQQRVRAVLVTNAGHIIFIERIKADIEPYFILPGGGVEPEDGDLEAALRRELCEELHGEVEILASVFVDDEIKDDGTLMRHHVYLCRIGTYDPQQRSGPEFGDPANGLYSTVEVPFEPDVLRALNIRSAALGAFLIDHAAALRAAALTP